MWLTTAIMTTWINFIKEDSDGLTTTGQKLLQQAIESYVYCVLDAQAKTRWSVVDEGVKSLQTQSIFHKLVEDTIALSSTTTAIANMRTAIKSTNVVLNMVISPGVILIPSDIIIIKKKIPGFNNTLTLTTSKMKFGENKDVNVVVVAKQDISENNTPPSVDNTPPSVNNTPPSVDNTPPSVKKILAMTL